MKDFFGLPLVDTPPEFFDKWHAYARNAFDFSPATLGVAAFTLLVILIVRRKIPKSPPRWWPFPVHAACLAVQPAHGHYRHAFRGAPRGLPDFTMPEGITFERILNSSPTR